MHLSSARIGHQQLLGHPCQQPAATSACGDECVVDVDTLVSPLETSGVTSRATLAMARYSPGCTSRLLLFKAPLLHDTSTCSWCTVAITHVLSLSVVQQSTCLGAMQHACPHVVPDFEGYFQNTKLSDLEVEICEEVAEVGEKRKRGLVLPGHSMVMVAFSSYCKVKVRAQ